MDDSSGTDDGRRSDRLSRTPTPGPRNSPWSWTDAKPPDATVADVAAEVVPSRDESEVGDDG